MTTIRINKELKTKASSKFINKLKKAVQPYGHLAAIARASEIHVNTLYNIVKSGEGTPSNIKKIEGVLKELV